MSDKKNNKKGDNVINIQKFQPKQTHEFTKEEMPYTQICNKVINECTNPVAGFIWIYLQSKPVTWKPCKWEIIKRFDISERTYFRHMKYLIATNLIETFSIRDDEGKVVEWCIRVLNGSRFNPSADDYKGTAFVIHSTSLPPSSPPSLNQTAKNGSVEEPAPDKGFTHTAKNGSVGRNPDCQKSTSSKMAEYINTRSTSLEKKDNIYTSTEVEGYLVSFEKFYFVYPRKKGKQDALKWFKKHKPTDEFVSMLIEDVTKRTKTEWNGKEPQYIPYPARYLNGKRWEDAIETPQPIKPRYPTPDESAANELKIREREMKAQQEKQAEIDASRNFKGLIEEAKRKTRQEIEAEHEAKRIEMGMTAMEYSAYVISKAKEPNQR